MSLSNASAVCRPCKSRKKKCDKGLPSCGRCSRMAIKCLYADDGADAENPALSPGAEYKLLKSNLSWNWPEARLLPEIVSPYSFIATLPGFRGDACSSNSHRKVLDFNEHLSRQALEIISRNNVNVEETCDEFFKRSIKWFPIIDRDEIFDRLPNIHVAPDPHFSVLLVCIYLFAQFWRATSDDSSIANSFDTLYALYFTAKGFHSLLQSTGRISVDSIQAGILLAMYEQCQNLRNAAALSIASCARMGYLIGLDKSLLPNSHRGSAKEKRVETSRRLWWAIVMIERTLHWDDMEDVLPFSARDPQLTDQLPIDGFRSKNASQAPKSAGQYVPVSSKLYHETPINLELTSNTAQVTYFLSKIYEHIRTNFTDFQSQQKNADDLERGLRAQLSSQVDTNWIDIASNCAPYSMAASALVCLHLHQFAATENKPHLADSRARTILAIKSMIRMLVQMLQMARDQPTEGPGLQHVPTWGVHCMWIAAMSRLELLEPDEDEFAYWTDMKEIKAWLNRFQGRWKIADYYLEKIEAAMSAKSCSWDSLNRPTRTKDVQMDS